jgi:hypothetical protein
MAFSKLKKFKMKSKLTKKVPLDQLIRIKESRWARQEGNIQKSCALQS